MLIKKESWGKTPGGQEILRYTLASEDGSRVVLCNIGAGIAELWVPDRDGRLADVVMGYQDPLSYIGDGPCSGRCPGRFANRVAKGRFTLDGKEYRLPVNNGPNHLHGGPDGFQNKIWDSREVPGGVEFMYYSEDGEAGYPGALKVVARYEWDDERVLRLTFTAECDAPTILNMTNHVYFNLAGGGCVLDHVLKINASEYIATDETLVPVEGGTTPVAGTPLDFQTEKPLGRDIREDFPALKNGKGYDTCFAIDGYMPGQLQTAAELCDPASGRCLEVLTTQPGVHLYTGNWLDGCPTGKGGVVYHDYDAVALECQHFPDSPNHPEYPGVVLRPGETFEEAIIWAFSTR